MEGPLYEGNDWIIAWNPAMDSLPVALEVGPWPDRTGWSDKYGATTGCGDSSVSDLDDKEQARLLVNQAADLMFSGIPPQTVLHEFSKIRVWRDMKVDLLGAHGYWAFLPRLGYEEWNPWTG